MSEKSTNLMFRCKVEMLQGGEWNDCQRYVFHTSDPNGKLLDVSIRRGRCFPSLTDMHERKIEDIHDIKGLASRLETTLQSRGKIKRAGEGRTSLKWMVVMVGQDHA